MTVELGKHFLQFLNDFVHRHFDGFSDPRLQLYNAFLSLAAYRDAEGDADELLGNGISTGFRLVVTVAHVCSRPQWCRNGST